MKICKYCGEPFIRKGAVYCSELCSSKRFILTTTKLTKKENSDRFLTNKGADYKKAKSDKQTIRVSLLSEEWSIKKDTIRKFGIKFLSDNPEVRESLKLINNINKTTKNKTP